MKKIIKIILVAVTFVLFFLNVNLNIVGDKVEGLSLVVSTQTAQAWDPNCWLNCAYTDCFCFWGSAPCGGLCPNGPTGAPCGAAIVE